MSEKDKNLIAYFYFVNFTYNGLNRIVSVDAVA